MTASLQRHIVYAGLGNPGAQYESTRHNIGYLVVKALARGLGWNFKEEKRFNAFVAKGFLEEVTLHILLPTTYMNLSGLMVKRYLDYYKLEDAALVVIVDDIALPFGQLRLKMKGSAGGHKGLKSVEYHLGNSDYTRLRMGIGHPGEQVLADYVLDPFNQEEMKHLIAFIDRGVGILKSLLQEDPAKVMNGINIKVL